MNTQTWLIALIVGVFAVYVWKQRRKVSDGKAFWWANVCEPIFYVSGDPFDETVTQRAATARALLEAHGNGYLNPETEVWEYVYSATPETATRDFSRWQDWVLLNVTRRREEWRQRKAENNQRAAEQMFAGQQIFSANGQN